MLLTYLRWNHILQKKNKKSYKQNVTFLVKVHFVWVAMRCEIGAGTALLTRLAYYPVSEIATRWLTKKEFGALFPR